MASGAGLTVGGEHRQQLVSDGRRRDSGDLGVVVGRGHFDDVGSTEGTVIVDPNGWVAAAAGPGPGLAIADIDLRLTHDKSLTEHVHLLEDRRVDLY